MTHSEVESRELVEAYVRGRLSVEDRTAFEEHYFACDECFEQVQSMEAFVAGVREVASTLPLSPEPRRWLLPVLGFGAAGAFAAATVFLVMVELPRARREISDLRQQAELQRSRAQGLEQQIASVRIPAAEANLPLAMLEASRAADSNTVTVPASASHLALWIDIAPGVRFDRFRLSLRNAAGSPVGEVGGLAKNQHAALSASLPASTMPPGDYRIALYGIGPARDVLIAEYRLTVRR